MAISHRNGDSRACGATTIVSGQNFVTVDGALWSVDGDNNTDGGGSLHTTHSWITIAGKGIIVVGDNADGDSLCPIPGGAHCDPYAASGDSLITVS
jgi:uncharacterized Zn-binding protein involved in type VI secretion